MTGLTGTAAMAEESDHGRFAIRAREFKFVCAWSFGPDFWNGTDIDFGWGEP